MIPLLSIFNSSHHCFFFLPPEMLSFRCPPTGLEAWEACPLSLGTQNGAAPLENHVLHPQNMKNRATTDPAGPPTLMSKRRKAGSLRDFCTPTFIAVLLRITERGKGCRCPLAVEWQRAGHIQWDNAGLEKEGNLVTHCNGAAPWGPYTQGNEPSRRARILCGSPSVRSLQ